MDLTLAAVLPTLLVAHNVADHWVQTTHQANVKGQQGWAGRIACAAHVFTYTLTAVVALTAVVIVTGIHLDWAWTTAGLTISAVSHYIADRRTPLRRVAGWFGKDPAWLDNGGLYLLDQSWHWAWLFVAALLMA